MQMLRIAQQGWFRGGGEVCKANRMKKLGGNPTTMEKNEEGCKLEVGEAEDHFELIGRTRSN